ncbi:aminoglycoside phosphotransferase family protein [Bacillus cereus group sp. BfR-BA-01380]|uniref:aminoglycoside phosphotransferase family protein n=1 Tax=Bacillus cereus group sp. BfR-BA-01380 TaxID=2920324 RepID=UPI001F5996A2|nr:aminoglycoside phosphotransferase family protein [Bacillus cereus group sp. BfR-BA-01380]
MTYYKHYIQKTLPHLPIHSFHQDESGWDNVAIIVNNEWLFRFPRKIEYAKKIPREKQLYEALFPKLQAGQIEVPNYHILYENQADSIPVCSYYKMIHGKPFKSSYLHHLSISEKAQIAAQLASFLAALHTVPTTLAKEWGFQVEQTTKYWKVLHIKLKDYLFNTFTIEETDRLNILFQTFSEQLYTSSSLQTVIHADLTHNHILFHPHKKQIAGIIDIGDAQIGDPAFDFAGLYADYGHDFTLEVYNKYTALTNNKDTTFFERIISFYQYSHILHDLVYGFETNNEKIIETNKQRLLHILEGMH